jgi:hypothetical protein
LTLLILDELWHPSMLLTLPKSCKAGGHNRSTFHPYNQGCTDFLQRKEMHAVLLDVISNMNTSVRSWSIHFPSRKFVSLPTLKFYIVTSFEYMNSKSLIYRHDRFLPLFLIVNLIWNLLIEVIGILKFSILFSKISKWTTHFEKWSPKTALIFDCYNLIDVMEKGSVNYLDEHQIR